MTDPDITAMPPTEWARFCEGFQSGYSQGIDKGRQLEHDEVATLQAEAVRIVHELAKVPPRDAAADRAAAEKRAARWGQ